MIFSQNTLKDDISSIMEKNDIHPRKYGMSSDRKIEDDRKAFSVKYVLNYHLDLYTFFQIDGYKIN